MSAMTSGMSPAIAQPIALSAEYLRWGADYWPEESCSHTLAREFYSYPVIVVAPVGIFYHLSMAAYGALAQAMKADGKEKSELSAWSWQHLDAAKFDLYASGSALITTMLLTSMVGFAIFAFSGEFLYALASLTPFLSLALLDLDKDVLSFGYSTNPAWYECLLPTN